MNKYIVFFIIFFTIFTISAYTNPIAADDHIRQQLTQFNESGIGSNNVLYFLDELTVLYEENQFKAFWYKEGNLTNNAYELLEVINNVEQEGLPKNNYNYEYLNSEINKKDLNEKEAALLDIYLTNSFFLLASHFKKGVIDPENYEKNWVSVKNEINLKKMLIESFKNSSIKETLYSLLPQSDEYKKLRNKLKKYKEIKENGGFIKINSNQLLKLETENEAVYNLKMRLKQTGDYNNKLEEDNIFDKKLEEAVIKFQKRHGLKSDGVVGPNTYKALNKSVDDILNTIIINMERLRWLPKYLGEKHILVNIADYKLQVIEDKKTVFSSDVIVGREQRMTPVFSDEISYVVFNPYWNLPRSISVRDKLPKIKKDINYLTDNDYRVFKWVDSKLVEVDHEEIDWQNLNKRNFNYFIRQDPGPNNALGRVKFMFPNKYSVYLHDTPATELFSKHYRSFSSGCIRVEKPFELAEYILEKNNKWNEEKINEILETTEETTIYLENEIPIHIVYLTAWVDNQNKLNLRNDIYQRDLRLINQYFN